jgi:hypothetical protein
LNAAHWDQDHYGGVQDLLVDSFKEALTSHPEYTVLKDKSLLAAKAFLTSKRKKVFALSGQTGFKNEANSSVFNLFSGCDQTIFLKSKYMKYSNDGSQFPSRLFRRKRGTPCYTSFVAVDAAFDANNRTSEDNITPLVSRPSLLTTIYVPYTDGTRSEQLANFTKKVGTNYNCPNFLVDGHHTDGSTKGYNKTDAGVNTLTVKLSFFDSIPKDYKINYGTPATTLETNTIFNPKLKDRPGFKIDLRACMACKISGDYNDYLGVELFSGWTPRRNGWKTIGNPGQLVKLSGLTKAQGPRLCKLTLSAVLVQHLSLYYDICT